MAEVKERIRVLRQVEYGVLSNVENANGIVTLLRELGRETETSVAVAAAHCLRRIFTQLLDPAKNPQLPRPSPRGADPDTAAGGGKAGKNKKKNKKKRARASEDDGGVSASVTGAEGGHQDKAADVYQAWLEARYLDFLRVLLGWIAEVDDFHRQGPALRTLMQFVEIEPVLCVSAAKLSSAGRRGGGLVGGDGGLASPGAGTIWGGLFAELMRTIVLGPCSMEPKLLKSLGEDFVNVHDDIRYFLLASVTSIARQALADDSKLQEQQRISPSPSSTAPPRFVLPENSPLRGFRGTAAAFTGTGGVAGGEIAAGTGKGAGGSETAGGASAAASSALVATPPSKKKRKKRKKTGDDHPEEEGKIVEAVEEEEEEEGGGQKMDLAEISGRLARVLMVVRMVEEQSDLTAFLLPVRLSLPSTVSSPASSRQLGNPAVGLDGDASSSSSSDSSDDEEGEKEGRAGGSGKGKKKAPGKKGGAEGKKMRMLAIERLRYHKKAFGDAWLACLRLPLPPALYRKVLLFLPGNVIPYMPSPVRLADFLTAAYGLGGVRSVLALDALFLLMQEHDLDYPDFYDSLYRLVTPDMMYAKYRARFFRMVDLCLTSSHVPAYVVAAFLKRFARTTLQAPPSGALFTLALVRKLIGRHPECLPLISSRAPAVSDSKHRLLTSSGALSGTTGLKNRPLPSAGGSAPGGGGAATPPPGGAADVAAADEYEPGCEDTKGAGAMKTSLWELAALQNHYHPGVATLARGFLREADKKEAEGEAFAGPSKLAAETYQSLFEQEMRRKMGTDVPLAFRRPKGLFDDVPEEGGGVFAAVNFSIS